MNWEFTQEEFGKGEVSITGILTYTVRQLEKAKTEMVSSIDDLNHHIGFILNDLIREILQFSSGFDLIAQQSVILHRIEMESRKKLTDLGIELVSIRISDVWFYGVEQPTEIK